MTSSHKPSPYQDTKPSLASNRSGQNEAWTQVSKRQRLWTAIACWLGSLSFAGPGQWLSGRPIRAVLWFSGEFLLVGLWLLVASVTAGELLGGITLAIIVYHLAGWIDATYCGWKFRLVMFDTSLLRVLVMAIAISMAPLPAAMLALGPGREHLVEGFEVSEASMATTLLGQHANVRCLSCGFEFTVGLLAYYPDPHLGDNLRCQMCGQHNLDIYQSLVLPRDRVLASKRLIPSRWNLLIFRSPSNLRTIILKRVIGLPGEELQIINGEIFINGSLMSKEALAYPEMWVGVSDTKFHNHSSAHPKLKWQGRADAIAWRKNGRSWSFDAVGAWPQSLHLNGTLSDQMIYNFKTLQYVEPEPIHDIKLRVQLAQLEGAGELSVLWEYSDWQVRGSIDAGGAVSLIAKNNEYEGAMDFQKSRVSQYDGGDVELMLIVRDGYAYLYADGEQLARVTIGPFDSRTARRVSGQSCRVRITTDDCRGSISRIRLDRDVRYRAVSRTGMQANHTRPIKIEQGHYYVLGDNSAISSDSRLGWQIHPSLAGKIQPKMVPLELTEGVVTCLYWPLSRWRSFR